MIEQDGAEEKLLVLTSAQCDEERPVCRKCRVRFDHITECDYGRRDASDSSSADEAERPPEASSARVLAPRPERKILSKRDALPQPRSISPRMIDPFHSHPPCREPDIDVLMEACESLEPVR